MARRTVAAAAVLLATTAGCFRNATSAEQADSLACTLSPADRARAVSPAIAARTALLIAGPGLALSTADGDARGPRFALRTRAGSPLTAGSAAVVDRRGYLVTAGHLIGADPVLVIGSDAAGRPVVRPARLVYRGDDAFDFAVLHVAGPLPAAFDWLPNDAVTLGTVLVGTGTRVSESDTPTVRLELEPYAGRLTEIHTVGGPDVAHTELVGTMPVHHGDSGGPQYTVDGRLVGVLSAGTRLLNGDRQSLAVRPDLAWLRRLIDDDQRTLATAAGTP